MDDSKCNTVSWVAEGYEYRNTGAIYKSPVSKIGSNNVIVHPRLAWGPTTGSTKQPCPKSKPAKELEDRVRMSMLFKDSFSYASELNLDPEEEVTKVTKRPSSAPMERIQKIKAKLGYSTYTVLKKPPSKKKEKELPLRPASATVVRPPSTVKPGTRPASAASCRASSAGVCNVDKVNYYAKIPSLCNKR